MLILENNQWAYSTPVKRQVPVKNLADRAKAYGIDSYIVDGNDVVAVYTTAKEAVERARAGEGPILIEAKSMRMRGPRAARSGGVCAQGDVRILEAARSHRAV